ncbi:MAG: hypothetical protein U9Q15_00655 [Patescibacteria group bacterium]|nr:hypothetical protein [Patescibacteria group bacterium]
MALLLSTEYIPSFKDSILFIEECDEFNYQMVDRMFTQLEQT